MELDDIKSILRDKLEENVQQRSPAELETYIRKKTTSILSNIKKSIRFEWIISLVLLIVCLVTGFYFRELYYRFFSIFAVVVCVVFLYYIWLLNRKINYYESSPLTVKESLQQIIVILQRFIRLYFQLCMLTLPVAFVAGLIVGYIDISQKGFYKIFHWGRGLFIYISWFVIWSVLMYYFARWYIKKLYGKYLIQLKTQLKELENG